MPTNEHVIPIIAWIEIATQDDIWVPIPNAAQKIIHRIFSVRC